MALRVMTTRNEKTGTLTQLRVTKLNVNRSRGKREVTKGLTTGTDILGICETWIKASDVESTSKYTTAASVEPAIKSWRRF